MNKKYIIFDLDGTLIDSDKGTTKIILDYLANNFEIDIDEVRYYLTHTRGKGLKEQVGKILKISKEEAQEVASNIYKHIEDETEKGNFFPGAIETVKKLSKNYTLFICTGNSTIVAKQNLDVADILDAFEMVQGSELLSKSPEHIEVFKSVTQDEEFEKKSIFIGDGEQDRFIANTCGIDFIHIDENLENKYNDTFEVTNITKALPIIEHLSKK